MSSSQDSGPLGHESSQHLRDFKLAIEFKYLMTHAPGGVYLMPEFVNIRTLHGVIFLRRGLYRDGVFRFIMQLSDEYNGKNRHPKIYFTPPIFHPLIDAETGEFDVQSEESLKEWNSDKHFLGTVLTYMKKTFYITSFEHLMNVSNETARIMCHESKDQFIERLAEEAKLSQSRLYDRQPAGCTLIFTEPKPAHTKIKDKIFQLLNKSSSTMSASGKTSSNTSSSGGNSTTTTDRYADVNILTARTSGGSGSNDVTSSLSDGDQFLEQLIAEVKKPFVYDRSNEVEDAADR